MIKEADYEKRYRGMHIKYSDLYPVELLFKMIHYSMDNKGARLIQYSDIGSVMISLLKYLEWHVRHHGQLEFSIFVCLFFPDLIRSLRFRQNGHGNNKIFSQIYIYCNVFSQTEDCAFKSRRIYAVRFISIPHFSILSITFRFALALNCFL